MAGFGAFFWVGGAGVPPAAPVQAGHRPHAWWVGGAGVPAAQPTVPGYRSMLAWWTGGAGAAITGQPPAPAPSPGGGGIFPIPPDLQLALRRRLIEEDDLLLLLVASQFSKRLQ